MGEEKKDITTRKAKYQFKAFFWSLNKKATSQSNSEIQNRHNTDILPKKN